MPSFWSEAPLKAKPVKATERVGGDGKKAEIDGGYFGGYVKPANLRENRRDRRLREYQSGKRQCVVVIRERDGVTLPGVFKSEGEALDFIRRKVARKISGSAPTRPVRCGYSSAFMPRCKRPRTEEQKGDPVAVLRVDVRLHLEDRPRAALLSSGMIGGAGHRARCSRGSRIIIGLLATCLHRAPPRSTIQGWAGSKGIS